MDSDHALVCAKLSLRFGGCKKKPISRLNINRLTEPDVVAKYQHELAERLVTTPQSDVDEQWSHIRLALDSASLNSCGLVSRTANLFYFCGFPPDSRHTSVIAGK